MNNRYLLIAFLVLAVLFLLSRFTGKNKASSFDPEIVRLDTAKIDRMYLVSAGAKGEEFELKRKGSGWEATQGEIIVTAQSSNVQAILAPLADLQAKRMVTNESSRYGEYEITEEQAAKITVWQGQKKVADLFLGGFRFDQAARTASSFVRKADQPEVYMIDGIMSFGLKARFEQFRDKQLVKADASDLTSLQWMNASGHKQVLQKEDGVWYYAGMEAIDSTAISGYLTSLVSAQGTSFSEHRTTSGLALTEQLTIYGNNMLEPTVISAFTGQDTLAPFLIHSTVNPEAIFHSDSMGIYKRIFTDLRQFWPDGQ